MPRRCVWLCVLVVLTASVSLDATLDADAVLDANERMQWSEGHRADGKRFPNEVLAYVTPWNAHGYDVGKWCGRKLSWLSPVWHQLQPGHARLSGGHDVDQQWIAQVRDDDEIRVQVDVHGREQLEQAAIRIVPRVILEGWDIDALERALATKATRRGLVKRVLDEVEQQKYDGIVLEATQAKLTLLSRPASSQRLLNQFVLELGAALHQLRPRRYLVLVASPHDQLFSSDDMRSTFPGVDRYSLMTYDYPLRHVGPLAPIDWVRASTQRLLDSVPGVAPDEVAGKILMGLGFYGQDYAGKLGAPLTEQPRAIIGPEYIQLLKKHKPLLQHDPKLAEYFFTYRKNGAVHTVAYPTADSITKRLELAESLGVGIAIWEVGQGLDYWYSLL